MSDEYVTTTDGTGIVHQAPAYGEDDFRVCKAHGIELVDPLNDEGEFTKLIPEYEGKFVKDADKDIIRDLKEKNALVKHDTIVHSYPHCERTEGPLIYRAIPAWYVNVEKIKDNLVKNNRKSTGFLFTCVTAEWETGLKMRATGPFLVIDFGERRFLFG